MTFPLWSVPAAVVASAVVLLAWNLAVGAHVMKLASAGTTFRVLTGFCAFIFAPAIVIGVLAPTAPGARVLAPLAWLWPLVTIGIAAQATWALRRRTTNPWQTVPVLLFDVLVAWIALARWTESLGAGLPPWLLAPGVALSSLGATALGDRTYLWCAWLLLPALAPVAPTRGRPGAAGRTLVAVWCTVLFALVGAELPPAYDGLRAARTDGGGPMNERSHNDLAIGFRLFGEVTASPSPAAARRDLALADSIGVTAVHVTITPEGATAIVLDSVARVLEARRESITLVVTLSLADGDARRGAIDARWMTGRIAMVERVIQRLHPDVLLPAANLAPGGDAAWWEAYYERVARAARQIDRGVTVALATDAATPLDSVLCDWVVEGDSPLDAIALGARVGVGNPARFGRSQAVLTRWITRARTPPVVWLVTLPSAPAVDGEVVQQLLVRQALQWAGAHAWVRGIIAGDASDTWSSTGLRAASGRPRRALAEVSTVFRSLGDSPALPADAAAASGARATSRPGREVPP